MAVFRIEKNKNYTSMANYHFYDKSLSWKAKGILSNMLSLPDDWDYSLAGLTTLSSDGMSATRSAIKELEEHKYLIRRPIRKDGKICDWEYLIFEKPQEENLLVENLLVENQQVENHTQLNTKELNTKELNTKNNIYGEVVDYLNRKANTNYKSSSRDTQKHINARVTEGFTVDDFKTVIDKQCAKWIGTEWEQYLRPKTLFGTKFEDYLNSKVNNNQSNQLKKKEFNFIPTGVAERGEEYMEIDGKWFNRYGKELNSKGYEIIDFGLSKGW